MKTLSRSNWISGPRVQSGLRYFGSLPDTVPNEAVLGTDVVVHCAAWVHAGDRMANAVNVQGTIKLAGLSMHGGVDTFIFLSSQSARSDALSAYGKTKYAAEQELLSMDGQMKIIILRPGLVIGPGSTGLYHRLCRMVESLPVLPLLGGGTTIIQPIHVDDLCEAIFQCDKLSSTLHKAVLSVGHPQGITLAEFVQALACARLGRCKPTLSIPIWPAWIILRLMEAARIPLTISSGNLQGLRMVRPMKTEEDMARLQVRIRPLEGMLRDS